jgi:hypothetical protein
METEVVALAKALLDAMDRTVFYDLGAAQSDDIGPTEAGMQDESSIDGSRRSPLTAGIVRRLRKALAAYDEMKRRTGTENRPSDSL